MMINLFSSFDPSTMILSLNWMSFFISLMFWPMSFWFLPSRFNFLFLKMITILHLEFKIIMNSKFTGSTMFFISMFLMILMNNFLGLYPYIFTSTSHLVTSLAISLPMWMSFMLFGWLNNTNSMFSHLIPQGTPPILMPFMVMIESISNIIRPLTLAVRLTANIIAGHLLLTLLSNSSQFLSLIFLSMLIIAQLMLMFLEAAVAMIQSYVFSILGSLYSSEVI